MEERYGGVLEAYRLTFEWIFTPVGGLDATWSNLTQWLNGESGLYWINGKASSGKSTLLKFFVTKTKTRQCLSKWAKNDHLVVSHFFFWKSGTVLQKKTTPVC